MHIYIYIYIYIYINSSIFVAFRASIVIARLISSLQFRSSDELFFAYELQGHFVKAIIGRARGKIFVMDSPLRSSRSSFICFRAALHRAWFNEFFKALHKLNDCLHL
jgi:hypothetical protein